MKVTSKCRPLIALEIQLQVPNRGNQLKSLSPRQSAYSLAKLVISSKISIRKELKNVCKNARFCD